MRKILIATHGNFAQGIKDAAEIILGPQPALSTICAYTGDVALKDQLEEFFSSCGEEDEVIILTDLFGGSVNQACIEYVRREHTLLLTGVNLAMVLSVLTLEEGTVEEARLNAVVEETREQTMFVNPMVEKASEDDFDL